MELIYKDLTEKFKYVKKDRVKLKRLKFALDKNLNKYYDYYFESDNDLKEEIYFQKILERITGCSIYLNPKTHTKNVKTPDYYFKDTNELWNLKGIDTNSLNGIDHIFYKAINQTYNLILKQRNTKFDIDHISNKIKSIFENNQRKKISQIMLFDKEDNLILYYKR